MDNKNSARSVMQALTKLAEKKETLDWHTLMEGAFKLTALLQTEVDLLLEMEARLARMKAAYMEEGKTAAFAKAMIEATDEWLEYKKQEAFVIQCDKTILNAKKHASLSADMQKY